MTDKETGYAERGAFAVKDTPWEELYNDEYDDETAPERFLLLVEQYAGEDALPEGDMIDSCETREEVVDFINEELDELDKLGISSADFNVTIIDLSTGQELEWSWDRDFTFRERGLYNAPTPTETV